MFIYWVLPNENIFYQYGKLLSSRVNPTHPKKENDEENVYSLCYTKIESVFYCNISPSSNSIEQLII